MKIREFGTAEKKLFIVFCYYVILAVFFISRFTMASRNAPELSYSIHEYFCCEQGGNNPSNPCSRSEIGDLGDLWLEIVLFISLALFPVVNLLYAGNIQELKDMWRKIVPKASL